MTPQRLAITFVIAAGLLLAAASVALLAARTVNGMVTAAADRVAKERDAHWTAEIERSNAAAALEVAAQVKAALAIEMAANERVRTAEENLAQLEKDNAALPDGDARGISRARVRLLNR